MVARKYRTRVVFDTNVFVAAFLAQRPDSHNKGLVRFLLTRGELLLIVSAEVVEEYPGAFAEDAALPSEALEKWRDWFAKKRSCTLVKPGPRPKMSRDPDDNIFIATALAGRAEYLITNDRDLLELPEGFKADLPFEIVTPREFLARFKA